VLIAYGLSHPEELCEDRVLVGNEIDDAVRDHDVKALVRERLGLCLCVDELDVSGPILAAAERALANISRVMSIPVTWPRSPTIWVAMKKWRATRSNVTSGRGSRTSNVPQR
jgi:hypothetical protein